VPGLRGVHAAAQRQGRRGRVRVACHPGAIERRWTRELVISAMLEWRDRYGRCTGGIAQIQPGPPHL